MYNFFSIRIETLGCRLNQVESEALAVKFQDADFPIFSKNSQGTIDNNSELNDVGICVLNTCTVTGKAEQKARRVIRLLLKECIKSIVIVTGCYAELESETIEKISPRVIAFSGKKKDELIDLPIFLKNKFITDETKNNHNNFIEELKNSILEFRKGVYVKTPLKIDTKKLFKLSSPVFVFHSRASLKVQDGCNNSCSYCRIRLARGKAVSLPALEAVKRIKQIEVNGANEVVITGVNLAQYNDPDCGNFAKLLNLLLKNTNHIRIRISSLYPESITEEILPILKHERICPHFHLSIQSGSDKILTLMRRPYCKADIIVAIQNLRKVKDNPFIGCDIITGFPSESSEDFEETFSLCKDMSIPGVHVFPFSARPGTFAFAMKNKIPQRDSGERATQLSSLTKNIYNEYLDSCIGKIFFAILEKPTQGKPLQVVTENYLSLTVKDTFSSFKNYRGGEYFFVEVLENAQCRIIKDSTMTM